MKQYTFCTVQCTEAEFCEPTEEGKAPSVMTKIVVTDCEDSPGLVGKYVTEYRSLSGGAAEYTMEALRNLGWTCNDITELTGVGAISARGGVYEEEYQGKVRTKCALWPARPPRAKVTGKAKSSFAKKFKAIAKAAKVSEVGDHNKAVDRQALPEAPVQAAQLEDPFAVEEDEIDF